MRLILRRVASRPDGMGGVLLVHSPAGDLWLCVTLEDPWRNNAVGESCIPAGTYRCVKRPTRGFGLTFEVMHVPGRSAILFHPGNTELDTQGCILTGFAIGAFDDRMDIRDSRAAHAAMMGAMPDEFDLVIEDCFGGSTAVRH